MNRFLIGNKLLSRKLILALIGQIVGTIVLLVPDKADTVQAAGESIGALILIALSTFGYIQAEAKVDAARIVSGGETDVAGLESGKTPKQVSASVEATKGT